MRHSRERIELMLQITYTEEDQRLLEAADIAEARSLTGMYNQENFGWSCASPACLLGGYAFANPKSIVYPYVLGQGRTTTKEIMEYFGLTEDEYPLLFGTHGCYDAGTDGRKAAKFTREFVRARALARLEK